MTEAKTLRWPHQSAPAQHKHKKQDRTSELLLREAAAVVVVDTIPTLGIVIRAILCITALGVAKALSPALVVTHGHDLHAGRVAPFLSRDPAFAGLAATVACSEPTLLLTLLCAPDPELALRHGKADLRA